MKKLLTFFTVLVAVSVTSQNLQLHKDFERNHLTTTFELFKIDKYGNTFIFIDFDYNSAVGIGSAYYEIARVLKTEKMPVGLHIEYNSGLTNAFSYNEALIFGANYSKGNKKCGFSAYAGYKAFTGAGKGNFQVTGTWYIHLVENKLTFSGFADLWTENDLSEKTVFLSEPQLWYHLNKTFSVGGEVELTNNFAYDFNFNVRPTLGVKWNI
ncbi:MAG: DUF5020 family protein [Lutibacter sp.]|uniref:DUF5020 family protein n=1 Tax=Lutibacter sp. TaxID=1925666 RepID=UPI0019F35DE9|nr:DUF5020 family protein [Lutibacter sp.]NOR27334.1 DUF5020 family protein [Lutibacter sp.]